MYKIDYAPEALKDFDRLEKNEPAAFKKALSLIQELAEHPKTGPDILNNSRVNLKGGGQEE